MVTGIALLGVVTAALASWFVEQLTARQAEEEQQTDEELKDLTTEVRRLREEIAAIRTERETRPGG